MHNFPSTIHPDLIIAYGFAYKPSGLIPKNFVLEKESQKYAACELEMNNRPIRFRVAKITPTKIGQFVTLWKRIGDGPILPYDMADSVDLFVVSVRSVEHFGQFIFPKTILYEKGFISKDRKGGKRAMRVYPPWDITDSKQAQKTQAWQLLYFIDIPSNGTVDIDRIKKLFFE
ncbi:MepB family protein [Candidatus Dependentiae bacterium]|nr:MepB family protein [Candidatus Dependentiae bacterium]